MQVAAVEEIKALVVQEVVQVLVVQEEQED
jgi:hypothetical protein